MPVVIGDLGSVVFGNDGIEGNVAGSVLASKIVGVGKGILRATGKVVSNVRMIRGAINGGFVRKEAVSVLVGL
jgi:hypothetical protein